MSSIEKTLPILLNKYKSLHIPNFGTFNLLNERFYLVPNKKTYVFLPSTQRIEFNEAGLPNDFLIKHLCFSSEKTFDSVKEEINEMVNEWKASIKSTSFKTIENFGDLKLNPQSNELIFKSSSSFFLKEKAIVFSKKNQFSFKKFFSRIIYYIAILSILAAIFYTLIYYLTPYEIKIPEGLIERIQSF